MLFRAFLVGFGLLYLFLAEARADGAGVSHSAPSLPPQVHVTCQNLKGSLVHFFDSVLAPREENRRTVLDAEEKADARLDLVYAMHGQEGRLLVSARGRGATTFELAKGGTRDTVTFVGFNENHGTAFLLTYFPRLGRVLWSIHDDRLDMVANAAVGRLLIGECRERGNRP